MVTLFLVFIITKGALTLYEGNTIGSGAVRGGDTAQYNIACATESFFNLNSLLHVYSNTVLL